MPRPKRQVIDTICPLCGTSIAVKRTGELNKSRFDVSTPEYAKVFVRVKESMGRARGFAIIEQMNLQQAQSDPNFREYVDRLHASVTMLKEYLDRINP